jgi:two-component system sensor histidine kinase BaeS
VRRRITIAIVGAVAVALLLTGFGTLLISRFEVQRNAQSQLVADAKALVPVLQQQLAAEAEIERLRQGAPPGDTTTTPDERLNPQQRADLLGQVGRRFHLEDEAVLVLGPDGLRGIPPKGIPMERLSGDAQLAALRSGNATSGRHGSQAWAAAPTTVQGRGGRRLVVALTRNVNYQWGNLGYFLIAGGAVLLLAVLLSLRLSRRLIKPLQAADDAARRIAGGDLTARVPEPAASADDELAQLSRAINNMAENLERSRGLERQFLLSVSHDLRTPLTSIRGYAEAITDGTADDARAAAGVILGESRRLERLVRDLLDLAMLDARRFSLHPVHLDAAELAAQSAGGFRPHADEAGVAVLIPPTTGPCWVVADPDRLSQVVANLVENALKFARSGVTVTTSAGLVADHVVIEVTDDGPGIAAEDLPHVFERLYVSRARPGVGESGSGLGLAIVHELVSAMGGRVEARSPSSATTSGEGTSMLVTLPAAPPPHER